MANIYGALGIADNERVMLNTFGQRVIFDAVQQVLDAHNADLAAAMGVFVARTTPDYKVRYKLPGGGRLQRTGHLAQAGAVKSAGGWDVAFPIEDFGTQIAADRVSYAYMTTQDLARHMSTVQVQNVNTVRFEILKALLNSSARTFSDEQYGDLTVQPLANGDAVVYPPVIGAEDGTTDTHYLESNYAATAISDTNDPFPVVAAELSEHFGRPTGNGNLVAFINSAQAAKVKALTAFNEVTDRFVQPGDNVNTLTGLPASLPGRVIGRHTDAGVWVVEWDWLPSGYLYAQHLDAEAPLQMRVDPEDTGLGVGLQLVAESDQYPFSASHYSHRFGVGAANRLNGVVMEFGVGGSYTVPSAYA